MDSKGKLNNTNRKFRNFKDKIADSYKTTNNIDSNWHINKEKLKVCKISCLLLV